MITLGKRHKYMGGAEVEMRGEGRKKRRGGLREERGKRRSKNSAMVEHKECSET